MSKFMIASSVFKMFIKLLFLSIVSLPVVVLVASAQQPEEEKIKSTNQKIDNAVVEKDFSTLTKLYGDDFIFTHGTGTVDTKNSWIDNLRSSEAKFISRKHDSMQVELHHDIAILAGKLSVVRMDKEEEVRYSLRYVRVFALRKKVWQLISHRTTHEWHH